MLVYESLYDNDSVDLIINMSSDSAVGAIFRNTSHVVEFVVYKYNGALRIRPIIPQSMIWNNVRMIRLRRAK